MIHYSDLASEIEFKTFQALLVFRKKGGPSSIPVSEVYPIFAPTHPGVSEEELLRPIFASKLLRVEGGRIYLADGVNDIANQTFRGGQAPSDDRPPSASKGGCMVVFLLIAAGLGTVIPYLAECIW